MPRASASFTPRYQRLATELIDAIKRGEYQDGDVFPSEREIGLQRNLSRHTVRSALKLLTEEGWVVSYAGKGSYVQSPPRKGESAALVLPKPALPRQVGLIARASSLGDEMSSGSPLLGIKSALSLHGYSLSVSVASKDEKKRLYPLYPQWLKERAMAGYILASAPPHVQEFFAQRKEESPALSLGYLWTDADLPSIKIDYAALYEQAIMHLVSRKLVPFFNLASRSDTVENRRFTKETLNGYQRGLERLGVSPKEAYLIRYNDSSYDLVSALRGALQKYPKPRALLLGSGQHLPTLFQFFEQSGISVPSDLYILVMQSGSLPRIAYGRVAYFEYDAFSIAQRAGEKLLELISTGQTYPRHEFYTSGTFFEPHL